MIFFNKISKGLTIQINFHSLLWSLCTKGTDIFGHDCMCSVCVEGWMYSTCLCHTGQQLAGAGLFLHPHKTTLHFRERERERRLCCPLLTQLSLKTGSHTLCVSSKDWFHTFIRLILLLIIVFIINNWLPADANEFAMLNILRNVSKCQWHS